MILLNVAHICGTLYVAHLMWHITFPSYRQQHTLDVAHHNSTHLMWHITTAHTCHKNCTAVCTGTEWQQFCCATALKGITLKTAVNRKRFSETKLVTSKVISHKLRTAVLSPTAVMTHTAQSLNISHVRTFLVTTGHKISSTHSPPTLINWSQEN